MYGGCRIQFDVVHFGESEGGADSTFQEHKELCGACRMQRAQSKFASVVRQNPVRCHGTIFRRGVLFDTIDVPLLS